MYKMKRLYFASMWLAISIVSLAGTVTPASGLPDYYSRVDNQSGKNLFDAIQSVAKVGYSSLSYDGLWTAYHSSDVYPSGHARAGQIWDMYGECASFKKGQCGNYSVECDCYNREHSIPKSWFGGSTSSNTPGSDLFHVVPTDGKVNGMRSNYAFGEVSSSTYTYNGNKLGTAKSITIANTMLGASATASISSKVFEPLDEYKGDFARGYFATMVRWAGGYSAFTQGEGDEMFSGTYTATGHFGLTNYGLALLMKWHRQDPVSQKEIDRNNGIQQTQGNRNPFIDYPYLAEYLWGSHSGETVSMDDLLGSFESDFTPGVSDGHREGVSTPTLIVNPTDIVFQPRVAGETTTQSITIKGANLTEQINISVSGAPFSVSQSSISATLANSTNTIYVTYAPTTQGTQTGYVLISSQGAEQQRVDLSGTCSETSMVRWVVNGESYGEETQVVTGGRLASLPTAPAVPADCEEGHVFVGWTAMDGYHDEEEMPADLFSNEDDAPNINDNISFHAVFALLTEMGGESTTTLSMSTIAAAEGTIGDFTIATAQNTGSNAPTYNTNGEDVRVYAAGTLTISTSGAYPMTRIVFAVSDQGDKRLATITASSGTMTQASKGSNEHATCIWEGNAGSVTFTVGGSAKYGSESTKAGQLDFTGLAITVNGGGYSYSDYTVICGNNPGSAVEKIAAKESSLILQDGVLLNPRRLPLQVYNIEGRCVLETQEDVDIHTLSRGIYLVISEEGAVKMLNL